MATLDLLQKSFLHSCGQRGKVKGKGENTKPLPFPPSPFPDLCKKSIAYERCSKVLELSFGNGNTWADV